MENNNNELTPKLFVTVKQSQEALAKWIVPDSGISDADVLNELLGILDNHELVKAMREFESEIKK